MQTKTGGNLHKVNHPRIGRGEHALLVEQALLLINQPQRFVIHQDDFHIQLIFRRGSHFLNVHHQAAVAGEADDLALRVGQRRADRGRQAKAHGAETAGGQPLARAVQRIRLRDPHLVLAHVGGDDSLVVNAGGDGVNQAIMGKWVLLLRDGAGELPLQFGHQLQPCAARLRLNLGDQLFQHFANVALNRHVRLLDFTQL